MPFWALLHPANKRPTAAFKVVFAKELKRYNNTKDAMKAKGTPWRPTSKQKLMERERKRRHTTGGVASNKDIGSSKPLYAAERLAIFCVPAKVRDSKYRDTFEDLSCENAYTVSACHDVLSKKERKWVTEWRT
jgi:hypothetical protein